MPQRTAVLLPGAFIEQSVTNERDQIMELVSREPDRLGHQRIDSAQYRLNLAKSIRQIVINPGSSRMVSSGRVKDIEMMANRIVQVPECAYAVHQR